MSDEIPKAVTDLMQWLKDFASTRINFRLQNRRRCIQPHVILEFGRHGIFGIQVPKKYGGLEFSHTSSCRIIEQLGGIDLTLAAFVGQNNMGIRPIVEFGTPEQKDEFLFSLANGQILASFAITEPTAGSDVMNIQGTLRSTESGTYLLNAEKTWIGTGSWSGIACVIVKHYDKKIMNRMTACIVRAGTKGYQIGEECLTVGMRGSVQNHLSFQNVVVDKSDILGLPEQGLQVANNTMELTRLGIGAMSLGAMKRCFIFAHRYASHRKINTGLLREHGLTKVKLNCFIAKIKALESLIYTATKFLDYGQSVPVEIHIVAKVMGSEFLGQMVDETLQLLGARGYTENNLLPYFFMDARALRIFEGPSEVLIHYGGSLMSIKQRRKSLFELLQSSDLLSYFEQLNDIFSYWQERGVEIFCDNNWKSTVRGQVLAWLVLIAATRLNNQCKPFPEFALTDNWLNQKLTSLLYDLKNYHFFKNFVSDADMYSILNSFDFIDIEQNVPDEDTMFDNILSHSFDTK